MAFNLKKYNTFGLDINAIKGFEITDFAMFSMAFAEIKKSNLPYLVLGEGSDVLFTTDFNGVVLVNKLKGYEFTEDIDYHYVKLQAGENFHNAILTCMKKGIHGLENLALIPGTAGAAPVQNIGAYGVSFSDFCRYVEVLDLLEKRVDRIWAKDCEFGYRSSIFKDSRNKHRYIITAVELKIPKKYILKTEYASLKDKNIQTPQDLFEIVCQTRKQKLPDPHLIGNAGSFFKNPLVTLELFNELTGIHGQIPSYPAKNGMVKLAAGGLIDHAGCKGIKLGKAGTYENQALVVVNNGGATPEEIVNVARYVQSQVREKYGIALEPEVRIYGRDGECGL